MIDTKHNQEGVTRHLLGKKEIGEGRDVQQFAASRLHSPRTMAEPYRRSDFYALGRTLISIYWQAFTRSAFETLRRVI